MNLIRCTSAENMEDKILAADPVSKHQQQQSEILSNFVGLSSGTTEIIHKQPI